MSKIRELPAASQTSRESGVARTDPASRRPALDTVRGALPLLGALAIDLADFLTLGPVGVIAGAAVGGVVTWAVCVSHKNSKRSTLMWTTAGALYCAIPFTELLPLATLVALLSRHMPARKALAAAPVAVRQTGPARRNSLQLGE